MPQLILFLDLYEDMKIIRDEPFHFEERKAALKAMCNVEIQTELHPIPYKKTPNCTFSLWDLRRQAIQLANIQNSRTHSTQTDCSIYRTDADVQTADFQERDIQTMNNASTITDGDK